MYLTLPESASRKRTRAGYAASALLHATLLGALLADHGWTAEVRDEPQAVPLRFSVLRPAEPTRRAPTAVRNGAVAPSPSVPSLNIPLSIPNGIPELVSVETPFDPSEFERRAFAAPARGDLPAPAAGTPLPETAVDRQIAPIAGNTLPHYPAALQAMRVEGSVTMRFVVDTLGMVQPTSVEVVRSAHPLFERSVREALVRMRFTAAEVKGKKVAQIAEQTFHFAMRP